MKQQKSTSSKAGARSIKAMPLKKTSSQPRKTQSLSSNNPFARTSSTLFHRLRDRDLIYNVTSSGLEPGINIRIPTNPRFWPNTRAFQESLGWQTYIPHRIVVKWLPSVAATTAGQILGGTIYKFQTINNNLIANALLSTAKSYAGPIWEPCSWEFDLSALTQAKYLLNDTEEDGVPCDLFIVLPDTAVGMISIEYDISFYGHSTAPISIPVYDLIPRQWSAPSDLVTSSGVFDTYIGLVNKNHYKATITTSRIPNGNIKLTTESGGSGPIAVDCSIFNSEVNFYTDGTGHGGYFAENSTPLFLNALPYQSQIVPIWLSGPSN